MEPVFIVGVPRSGTTLLQLLISSHSNFFSLPETHFFTYILPNLLIPPFDKNMFFSDFFKLLEGKPKIHFSEREKAEIKKKLKVDPISDDIIPKKILEVLIEQYKKKNSLKGKRWVEKTPRHINHLSEIFRYWPNAKIIHIYRDPRDVISSFHCRYVFKSLYKKYKDLFIRCSLYKRCIRSRKTIVNDKILDVKYEYMVDDISNQLKQIMNFIGDKVQNRQITNFASSYDICVTDGEDHKNILRTGKILNRKGLWKKRLENTEIWWIEHSCKHELQEFEYELSQIKPNLRRIILIYLYFFYYMIVDKRVSKLRFLISNLIPNCCKQRIKKFLLR